jgi:hypothetical protein
MRARTGERTVRMTIVTRVNTHYKLCTGFSNYDAANMLVKASKPRLVQLVTASYNENLVI